MNALIARGLNPERIAALPHGVRARYSIGCRCVPCRKANSEYESARARARKAGSTPSAPPMTKAASCRPPSRQQASACANSGLDISLPRSSSTHSAAPSGIARASN